MDGCADIVLGMREPKSGQCPCMMSMHNPRGAQTRRAGNEDFSRWAVEQDPRCQRTRVIKTRPITAVTGTMPATISGCSVPGVRRRVVGFACEAPSRHPQSISRNKSVWLLCHVAGGPS